MSYAEAGRYGRFFHVQCYYICISSLWLVKTNNDRNDRKNDRKNDLKRPKIADNDRNDHKND